MKNKTSAIVISSALLGSLLIGGSTAFAETTSTTDTGTSVSMRGHRGGAPGVFGTVSAINGSTITLDSKGFGPNATAATYVVDAAAATVTKDGAASTLSAVAVGDMVMAEGTVSGTSVTATAIRDGKGGMKGGRGMGFGEHGPRGDHGTSSPMMNLPAGNGQPVVAGSVTGISGTTFTISNKAGASFTIDATSATVTKQGAASTVSAIAVGDTVVVQGTVSGSAVTAATVMDHGVAPTAPAVVTTANGTQTTPAAQPKGFFGMLGGFFGHFFGF